MRSLVKSIFYGISFAIIILVGSGQPFSDAHMAIQDLTDVPYDWVYGQKLMSLSPSPYIIPVGDSFPNRTNTPNIPSDVDIQPVVGYVPPKSYEESSEKRGGRVVRSVRSLKSNKDKRDPLPPIVVLAPNHPITIPVETVKQSPTLFWYLFKSTDSPLIFRLIDPDGKAKDWEKRIEVPQNDGEFKAGLYNIQLDEYGIELDAGVSYRWSITIEEYRSGRARNPYSSVGIRFIENPGGFDLDQIASLDNVEKAKVYAKEGFWYDAFSSLSRSIHVNKNDCHLFKLRSQLLEHKIVDLSLIAKNLNKKANCT